ncbi:MAG TPA: beta-propeller fold lactonase family protein [Xanthobacteraceae bacterium]|nr:beta-propeller fold lactonase family protein [Xanthobacteraceae bacterium]
MFNRRTVSAMLAGTVAAPSFAFAQRETQQSAFYSGVGNELTHYEVDAAEAGLARRGSIKMPGGIQYAWPHPSNKYLYVTSSTGGPGFNPGPGFPANQHHLAAFRIGPTGELTPHGEMVKLRWRPIHSSIDVAGEYVLVAYNFPAGLSVHKIKGDGTIGDEVVQPDNLEKGIYFHQVRATPGNKTILVVARGNNPEGNKPEDPGSLHVFGFKNGVLSNLRKIAPNGGYGFGPRHLDIHPARPLVYVSIERQNQLIVYQLTPDGDLMPEPLFTKPTLADPAHKFPVQSAGPIHIHPNGRFVYLGNRSGVTAAVVPGVEEIDGKKVFSGGESNIAVFAIADKTGEPNAIQHADIHAAHPRTFSLDASAKLLVAASLAPTAVRGGDKVVAIPAGLSVFRVSPDGKLDFVRKYDLDVGGYTQWWSGMVVLA